MVSAFTRSFDLQESNCSIRTRDERWRRIAARTVQFLACSYLALARALWGIIHLFAEQRWFTTLPIYGPRWIWATPLLLLIPAAAFLHRRSLLLLLAATYVVVWPIMDLRLPWRKLLPEDDQGLRIRVLTCNTHGDAMNVDLMSALITRVDPDVVALEEAQDEGEVRASSTSRPVASLSKRG